MGLELEGKVAIVTGGAKGIGRAVARALSEAGASVALFDVDGREAETTAAAIQTATGRPVRFYPVEVTQGESVHAAVANTLTDLGGLHILVNNAGIWRGSPLLDMPAEEFDRVLEVNVKGPFLMTQAVAPHLMGQRSGKIVNIASVAGLKGSSPWGAYCASKAALINLTETFAQELASFNVQCNAFLPGATRTPMLDQIVREEGSRFPHALPAEEVARQIVELVVPYDQTRTGEAVRVRVAASG